MTLWSDRDIKARLADGTIAIEPFDEARLQPASVDLLLGAENPLIWQPGYSIAERPIEPWVDQTSELEELGLDGGCWTIPPYGFALASTAERLTLDRGVAGRLEGKSSLARLGLLVHATAGFIDPGFEGYVTLELVNATARPFKIRPGMPVAQMSYLTLRNSTHVVYSGKYQGQGPAPAPSQYHRNFTTTD